MSSPHNFKNTYIYICMYVWSLCSFPKKRHSPPEPIERHSPSSFPTEVDRVAAHPSPFHRSGRRPRRSRRQRPERPLETRSIRPQTSLPPACTGSRLSPPPSGHAAVGDCGGPWGTGRWDGSPRHTLVGRKTEFPRLWHLEEPTWTPKPRDGK